MTDQHVELCLGCPPAGMRSQAVDRVSLELWAEVGSGDLGLGRV